MGNYMTTLKLVVPCDLWVVPTAASTRFVTLESWHLFSQRVVGPKDGFDPGHAGVAEWADIVVVAPASAELLSTVARGGCNSVLSGAIMATTAPVLLFPSMNATMWSNPAVQHNVRQVRQFGHTVVEPVLGRAYEANIQRVSEQLVMPQPKDFARIIFEALAMIRDQQIPDATTDGPTTQGDGRKPVAGTCAS